MTLPRPLRSLARAARPAACDRLADVSPGCRVCMAGFAPGAACWLEQLQAYGIVPGCELEVVQQSPVTVVRVDHVDLAFEATIAREIVVETTGA